jgi:hypothetical protein
MTLGTGNTFILTGVNFRRETSSAVFFVQFGVHGPQYLRLLDCSFGANKNYEAHSSVEFLFRIGCRSVSGIVGIGTLARWGGRFSLIQRRRGDNVIATRFVGFRLYWSPSQYSLLLNFRDCAR